MDIDNEESVKDQPIIELVVSDFGNNAPNKRLHRVDGKKHKHHHHHKHSEDDEDKDDQPDESAKNKKKEEETEKKEE